MRGHRLQAMLQRANLLPVNHRSVAGFRIVGSGFCQPREKCVLKPGGLITKQLLRKLYHARRVGNYLHGLNARNVVKEPSAAGVHQLCMALHLHQLQRALALRSA